jgi:hypothetical protein
MDIRTNNIGTKPVQYLDNKGKESSVAIVKYHENRYYGLLESYLKDGWKDMGKYIQHGEITLSKSLFEDKEDFYIIALVKLADDENETELKSIGDRLLYIDPKDREDFFEVYKEADKALQLKTLEYCKKENLEQTEGLTEIQ